MLPVDTFYIIVQPHYTQITGIGMEPGCLNQNRAWYAGIYSLHWWAAVISSITHIGCNSLFVRLPTRAFVEQFLGISDIYMKKYLDAKLLGRS